MSITRVEFPFLAFFTRACTTQITIGASHRKALGPKPLLLENGGCCVDRLKPQSRADF